MIIKMIKIISLMVIAFQQITFANLICERFYKIENSNRSIKVHERVKTYRKKIQNVLSETSIVEGANSLHKSWQETNTYLTRYKLMLDTNSNPITDFESYVATNGIPEKLWVFYQKNENGHYEEDLRGIPN